MNYQCIFCHTKAFEYKVSLASVDEDKKNCLIKNFTTVCQIWGLLNQLICVENFCEHKLILQ